MNATRSLVPTPSALATSTGSAMPACAEPEQAAERADLREHAGRERAARQRPDAPDDLVAGVDVDAGLLVVHSELERLDQRVGDLARGRALRRLPVAAADRRRRTAPPRSPPRACRTRRGAGATAGFGSVLALEHLQHQRRVAQRDARRAPARSAARAGIARSACRPRAARRPRPASPDDRQRGQARRRGAQQLLEAQVGDREPQRCRRGTSGATRS